MSPRHPSGKTDKKRGRVATFAFVVVVLLVGAALLFVPFADDEPTSEPTESIASYDPTAEVAALATPSAAIDEALAAAAQATTEAQGEAGGDDGDADVQAAYAALTEAAAAFEAAVGDRPEILGEDGDPIELVLIQTGGSAWSTTSFETGLPDSPAAHFTWIADPSQVPEGDLAAPQTGNATLDEALAQLEDAFVQVQDLWTSPEVEALWEQLDGTPVGAPSAARDPFGATGVVEPDEDGAVSAQAHADHFLETVGGGYGSLSAGLDAMLAAQQTLVADTQAALDTTSALEADAAAALDAKLEGRQQALTDAAAAYEEAVHAAAAGYADDVASAQADLETAADAYADAVQAAREDAESDLRAEMEARVAAVEEDAAARLAAIDGAEADALAALQAQAEAGADVAAEAEAYAAAAADARADIASQVVAVREAAAQAVAEVQAKGDTQVVQARSLAADAGTEVQARADAALAVAAEQEAFLAGTVEPALQSALDHQTRLHAQARAAVAAVADAHRGRIVEDAHALVGDAQASATAAVVVVEQVQADAEAEVSKDLGYIEEVAEDYAAAPTPEREAKAAFWSDVHAGLAGQQSAALGEGEAILSTAAQLLVASQAAGEGLATI